MKPVIIYDPLSHQTRMVKRVKFTPLSQQTKGIGGQILDYFRTGKALSPVIKTEVIIPPETKQFVTRTILITVGSVVGGILLFRAMR